MSLSGVLDIVIGLSFIYFLMALFCSWMNEAAAAIFNRRGRFLFDGLREMLEQKDAVNKSADMLTRFVKHPLIESLDKVRDATGEERKTVNADATHAERIKIFPSYMPASTVATVLLDLVSPKGGANRFKEVREQIEGLANERLRTALLTIADRADNDIEALRKGVEDWYSNTMDRVSGWYKSHSQYCLIGIGLIFAALLNVDTLRVGRELWDNPSARAELVKSATEMTKADGDKEVKKQLAAIDAAKTPEERAKLQQTLNKQLDSFVKVTERASIPLGWNEKQMNEIRDWGGGDWFLKLFGILVTAAAIALGAPFWFDLVNKLVDVRGAGPKPEDGK